MSHFIGLVFSKDIDVESMLAPYDEQTDDENYLEFTDCTDEVQEKFDSLPEKDERLKDDGTLYEYLCDKEHYPTLEALAKDWYGYEKNEDGIYGYTENPNAKWDWYALGNRWSGFLFGKDGEEHNELRFNEIDWEKMFTPDDNGWDRIPFCFVDTDANWYEKGDMGWWGCVSNEKPKNEWGDSVKSYIKQLQELPEEEQAEICVYAIDFHI